MYDPELPAGLQDADFEMRDLQAAGARDARLRKAGRCPHGWSGPKGAQFECYNCGFVGPASAFKYRRTE